MITLTLEKKLQFQENIFQLNWLLSLLTTILYFFVFNMTENDTMAILLFLSSAATAIIAFISADQFKKIRVKYLIVNILSIVLIVVLLAIRWL